MRTVIIRTKKLGIIDNRLVVVGERRHVILVGERLNFEIEIKNFKSEPRCFDLCLSCIYGRLESTEPKGCDDLKNMRRTQVICGRGEDVLIEENCGSYSEYQCFM